MLNNSDELERIKSEFSKYIIDANSLKKTKLIGKGGYAEVWLVTDEEGNSKGALKQLYSECITEKDIVNFTREVQTLAASNHPFFVKFLGFSPQFPLSILTEYIPNGSLFKLMRSESKSKILTGSKKTVIAMGVANAMHFLHLQGIIHRDLKSMNVLLDSKYYPRICDFGIARIYRETPQIMTVNIGTPHWMAPEALNGEKYGFPFDVYSYGMLLYELLTEKIPWENVNQEVVMRLVMIEGKRPQIPQKTPQQLKDLIEKCWAQNPDERPTFEYIYEQFASGNVSYPNAKQEDIDELKEFLENNGFMIQHKEKRVKKVKLVRNSTSEVLYEFSDLTTNNPKIQTTLKKALSNLNDQNCKLFWKQISPLLSPNVPRTTQLFVINNIPEAITTKAIAREAIAAGIHKLVDYCDFEAQNSALTLYHRLFTFFPEGINSTFHSEMDQIIANDIKSALILLQLYSQGFKDNKDPWDILDILLTSEKKFLKSDYATEYIETLYYLCSTHKDYAKARLENCADVFFETAETASKLSTSVQALNSIVSLSICAHSKLSVQRLTELLKDENCANPTVTFLLHCPTVEANPEIILALFKTAQRGNENAILVLCTIAEKFDYARIISRDLSWIIDPLPTILSTLRLFLVMFRHKDLREKLLLNSNLTRMFSKLLHEKDQTSAIIIVQLIILYPNPSKDLIQKLKKNKVLKRLLDLCVASNNIEVLKSMVHLVSFLSEFGDSSEYLIAIPKLWDIVKTSSSITLDAIVTIVNLSKYQLCALKCKELGMIQFFKEISSDPSYTEISATFIANIAAADIDK